jgi:HEAT repeat protein
LFGFRSPRVKRLFIVIVVLGASAAPVFAQSSSLSGILAEGWTALGTGDVAKAGKAADRALADAPRSAAAVALAVEVDIARGGPLAGLDVYERWLDGRRVDDAYVLRRIAQAHLKAVAKEKRAPASAEALKALTADGDQDAAAQLATAAASGGGQETVLLASIGDRHAIDALIERVQGLWPGKVTAIDALGNSGSPRAVPVLVKQLGDPQDSVRAAAAEALGKLGATDAIPQLKSLLNDPVSTVQFAAAGALYRLQDYSGVNMLDGLLTSEHATVRLSGAELMASAPSPTWQAVVKALLNEPDESVQLAAARLIAPYDPQAATATLDRLEQSGNMTIREEAAKTYVQRLAADFASLRRYLRNSDRVITVRAASRILELTR